MTWKKMVLAAAVAFPIAASAQVAVPTPSKGALPPGHGSCDYTSEDPKDKGTIICRHVADAAHCVDAARAKGSQQWIDAHPPKFTPGVRCDAKGAAKKPKASTAAKPQATPAPKGTPSAN
jgi:hypothetical protein